MKHAAPGSIILLVLIMLTLMVGAVMVALQSISAQVQTMHLRVQAAQEEHLIAALLDSALILAHEILKQGPGIPGTIKEGKIQLPKAFQEKYAATISLTLYKPINTVAVTLLKQKKVCRTMTAQLTYDALSGHAQVLSCHLGL